MEISSEGTMIDEDQIVFEFQDDREQFSEPSGWVNFGNSIESNIQDRALAFREGLNSQSAGDFLLSSDVHTTKLSDALEQIQNSHINVASPDLISQHMFSNRSTDDSEFNVQDSVIQPDRCQASSHLNDEFDSATDFADHDDVMIELPSKSEEQNFRVELPSKSDGQDFHVELPSKSDEQNFHVELASKSAAPNFQNQVGFSPSGFTDADDRDVINSEPAQSDDDDGDEFYASVNPQLSATSGTEPITGNKIVFPGQETAKLTSAVNVTFPPRLTDIVEDRFLKGLSSRLPDDDDDDFDFDELAVSRTQSKAEEQQKEIRERDDGVRFQEKDDNVLVQEKDDNVNACSLVEQFESGDGRVNTLQQIVDEWEQVQTIEAGIDTMGPATMTEDGMKTVTFGEALTTFDRNELVQLYGSSIKTSVRRSRLAAFLHRLCGGPRLHESLCAERNFVFCLAACPFDNNDPIHFPVLLSIYKQLTGSRFGCPRIGSHWEIIGFQGQDPATDLRGAGFLALLQLLHLVTEPRTEALYKSIYRLSLHETQNFPFCVMGINLTRMTMLAMREDCLNKECNRRRQIFGVMNDFYVGLFHRLYTIWKTQHKTIRDTGFVLADLEAYAKKNPMRMIRTQIEAAPAQQSRQPSAARDIAEIDTGLF